VAAGTSICCRPRKNSKLISHCCRNCRQIGQACGSSRLKNLQASEFFALFRFCRIAGRRAQFEFYEAIFEASLLRFRAILMTTSAAILGPIPLALSFDKGRRNLSFLGAAQRLVGAGETTGNSDRRGNLARHPQAEAFDAVG
jgi:AcrB/AcrD/AcrF family